MRPAEICADALSRRGFLRLGVAGAVMTVADWRLWAADEGLPAYYGEHLAKVAARLRALSKSCDDAFFFITDLHIPDNRCVSGRILAKLVAETDVKKVLCGGDMPVAFGGKESLDRTIAAYRREWIEAVERAGGEFYPAKGNHDWNGWTYFPKQVSEVFPDEAERARNMIGGRSLGDDWVQPLEASEPKPFEFARRAAASAAPAFPSGASLKVRKERGKNRDKNDVDVIVVEFPDANAVKGARALYYKVEFVAKGGERLVKRMLPDGFYLPEDDPKANGKCVFQIAADRLPAAECEVSVTPVNSLGKVGAALKG